jgi:hypothetical protein
LRALIARLIQHEIRIERAVAAILPRFAVVEIAPLVEQIRPEAAALDGLQELLGDDRIGIDVGTIQRCHQTIQPGEFFHLFNRLLNGFATLLDILADAAHGIATDQRKHHPDGQQCNQFLRHSDLLKRVVTANLEYRRNARQPPQPRPSPD